MRCEAGGFGRAASGARCEVFTLEAGGLRARLASYGARLLSLEAPDRSGATGDVTLGLADLAAYEASSAYLGAVVGRFANRIRGARIVVDGVAHALAANEGRNQLHGGPRGFDRAMWRAEPISERDAVGVAFSHESPAGDQGFPGRLTARARYRLLASGELRLSLEAECDAPTVVGLSHHPYWNLGREARIDGHVLALAASRYLPVDGERLPTGEACPVAGTRFDLRAGRPLRGEVFDHCFLLDAPGGPAPAARLHEPGAGRTLEVVTDAPAIQLYTGDGIGAGPGRGRPHASRAGLCLEPETPPDAPNQPALGDALLRPGALWRREIRYRLRVA